MGIAISSLNDWVYYQWYGEYYMTKEEVDLMLMKYVLLYEEKEDIFII